jgi:hypothetical protein
MLVNTSYNEKKINDAIDNLVGNSYTFFENVKLKGVGSPRLDILKTSVEIDLLLSYDHNRNFCNIELRPKGIIIRFRSLLETYSLVIPYYKLVIFKPGNSYTFHLDNHFITIDFPTKNKGIQTFINKINQFKIDNSPQYVDDL